MTNTGLHNIFLRGVETAYTAAQNMGITTFIVLFSKKAKLNYVNIM